MLALERIGFSTTYLQVEESSQVGNLLLDSSQSHHTVELLQTLGVIDCLWSLVWDILLRNRHQFLVRLGGHISLLQTLCLLCRNLVEQLAHGTSVGEVLVAGIIQLGNHLASQFFSIWGKDIFLRLRKDLHNLIQFFRIVVVDIQEITETAAHTRVDAEQILHLRSVTGSNNYKFASVVLHTFHQLLQCLGSLIVTVTALTDWCQCIGLIDKEDSSHCLVAQAIYHLWRLTLIWADHLGTVTLYHMAAVEISDSLQYLAQLTGNRRFTCTWVTRQYDMDASLLLFTQTTLGALYAVLYAVGNLADSFLHLIHTDVLVEIAQDIIKRTLLRNVATDITLLYHRSISTTTDERGKDVLSSLHCQMTIAEGVVLDFHLILEETLQLMICLRCIGGNAVFDTQFLLADVTEFVVTRSRQTEDILEAVLGSWVVYQEIVQTFGQTGDNHNRIIVPLVHFDKELIQRIHLIGIAVGQQFLNIIKEQDTILRLLDVIIPFINKALIIDGINHRQLRLVNNLVLIEVITDNLRKRSLTSTCLTDDNRIHAQAYIHDILARMEIGIGVNDCL